MRSVAIPGIIAPRFMKRFKSYAEDKRGVAAVEFALIATPFFFLIFGLLEVCLLFIMSAVLDHGLGEAAREIRTGQFQSGSSADLATFKQSVCDELFALMECGDKLQIDVKTFTSFGATSAPNALKMDGTLDTTGFSFSPGGANEIVVVRVFYEWDLITPILSAPLANMSENRHLIQVTTAFRNEPF